MCCRKHYKIQDQNCCKNVTNKNVIVEKGEEEEEGKEQFWCKKLHNKKPDLSGHVPACSDLSRLVGC